MPKNNKYKFFNLPRKYGIKDYNDSIDRIVKKYSKAEGLVSIYEWGSVSNPGISDLDIVFVFRHARPLPLSKRSFYLNDNVTRYLVRHPFVFTDISSLENIRCVNHNVKLRLLHGKKCKVNNIGANALFYVKAAIMNDLAVRHYPRDFIIQLSRKSINVRDTLLRLNSLRYTINTMKGLTGKGNKEWYATAKEIKKLRDSWFGKKDLKKLAELNERSVALTMEFVLALKRFLLDKKLASVNSGEKIIYHGAKNRSVFVKDWSIKTALKGMEESAKKGKFCSILPLELAPQLIEYSKGNGPISSYIKSNLRGNIDYKLKNPKIIRQRIKVLNNQAVLAGRLKHSDFPAFFDFGYRSRAGINNWVLNVLDMIKY